MRYALKLAAVVLFAACGDSNPVEVMNGSIRGTVTDNTGATVANASVALTGSAQTQRTTTSGADGVYTFANVPLGTYTLAVTPPSGWSTGTSSTTSVTVASATQANASAIVLNRVAASVDSCVVAPGLLRPNFGGPATAADRALFAYNVNAPLNLQKVVQSSNLGVQISTISFTSPGGGLATGMMFEPLNRTGLRPGIVLMHGLPGNAAQMSGLAHSFAQFGAVVVTLDAPFARRFGPSVRFTAQDRAEQIQLIQDLQRAVDILREHPNVDDDRIAYHGTSYGGAMGVLLVGIEKRIRTAVLMVPDGGLVTHYTGPEDLDFMGDMPCAQRLEWFRQMVPIEPIRYIGNAPPTPLLVQNGRYDTLVPMGDAQVLHTVVPQPSTILWYDAEHGLTQQALFDRHNWLHTQIGIDPLP